MLVVVVKWCCAWACLQHELSLAEKDSQRDVGCASKPSRFCRTIFSPTTIGTLPLEIGPKSQPNASHRPGRRHRCAGRGLLEPALPRYRFHIDAILHQTSIYMSTLRPPHMRPRNTPTTPTPQCDYASSHSHSHLHPTSLPEVANTWTGPQYQSSQHVDLTLPRYTSASNISRTARTAGSQQRRRLLTSKLRSARVQASGSDSLVKCFQTSAPSKRCSITWTTAAILTGATSTIPWV